MDTSALVPSQSGQPFAQQGTVDWTQLSRSSVALSVEILSRLSQARVEPLTLAVGQAICSRFLLPPDTQKRIQTTLAKLKPFSSYGNILWFGFGIKHVVRLLVESEQGMACVALCGGLSVSYDKFYCAQVLRSMTQIQSAPGYLSPSILQWSDLVGACSGTLLSSEFPNIVEGFSRLWYNNENRETWKRRGATSPYALSEALSTIADIASGVLQCATFIGGADCAWLAAIAEWVLCLTVEVGDAITGHCLYQKLDNTNYETAQVKILRTLDTQCSMVRLRDKTCFLPSGSALFDTSPGKREMVFAGGRSNWDSILADTFPGDYLERLFSSEGGSAFSTLLHIVAEEINAERCEYMNVLGILPELKAVLSCARTADQTFEDSNKVIKSICNCENCQGALDDCIERFVFGVKGTTEPCILCIGYSIVHYLWILAHVHLHDNVQPSSVGLWHLYFIVERSIYQKSPAVDEISQNHKYNILANVLQIMTGIPTKPELSPNASAVSESGLSICCASLLDPTLPPTAEMSVHLVPGHVQKDGILFREVYDLDSKLGVRVEEDVVMMLNSSDKLQLIRSIRQNNSPPKLLVKETMEAQKLQANYSWQHQLLSDLSQEKNNNLHTTANTSTKMFIPAFGSAKLQQLLFERISLPYCKNEQIQVMRDNNRFSGTCCKVTEDIMMQVGSSHDFLPQSGEWILLDLGTCRQPSGYYGERLLATKIYRGSVVELYSLLCNSEQTNHLRLVCASNCLFCTCLWKASKIIAVSDESLPTEVVLADNIRIIEDNSQEAGKPNIYAGINNDHRPVNGTSSTIETLLSSSSSSPPKTKSRKRRNTQETYRNGKRNVSSK